jgi:hypothetical protein
MKNLTLAKFSLTLVIICTTQFLFAQTGTISGKVIDEVRNDVLIGATVILDNNQNSAVSTNVEGAFSFKQVPVGNHIISIKYVSYSPKEITEVEVKANETTNITASMLSSSNQLKQIVIKSTLKQENINSLLQIQKNSISVQDGMSADLIRKSPDRNSSDVLKRIPGTSIIDNKFVVVRGLGDKYNSAMLNNSPLPSTEPDRKNFSFDLIPANMLESIVIIKTAQPDLPGDFAGGIIQQNLKDVPEKSFANFNITTSEHTTTTFRKSYDFENGKIGWLGFNDGSMSLPSDFPSSSVFIKATPSIQKVNYSQLIPNTWDTSTIRSTPLSMSYSFSAGWNPKKLDNKLGILFSTNYGNSYRTDRISRADFQTDKTLDYLYNDIYYRNNINWGSMLRANYKLGKQSKIGMSATYNSSAKYETVVRDGIETIGYYVQALSMYTVQNHLLNTELNGEHLIKPIKLKIKWSGGYGNIEREEPDYRRMYYRKNIVAQSELDSFYQAGVVTGSANPAYGGKFYSTLNEDIYNASASVSMPFEFLKQKQNVKTGFYFLKRDRSYDARVLGYIKHNVIKFNNQENPDSIIALPIEQLFSLSNIRENGFRLDDITNKSDNYNANSTLYATYLMFDSKFTEKLRAVWGARAEFFNQQLNSFNKSGDSVTVNTTSADSSFLPFDLLPSINIIYSIGKNTNIRLAGSKTVSRPEFRELVPFAFYDFTLSSAVQGNPKLRRTSIYNADLRLETYPGKGQIFAMSLFYKKFISPVEQVIDPSSSGGSRLRTFNNPGTAENFGVELEARKNFGFVDKWIETKNFQNLFFNLNIAFIRSNVKLGTIINGASSRNLQGQSPIVLNAGLGYNQPDGKYSTTVLFNVIGRRIVEVGTEGYFDIYEAPRPILDFQFSRNIFKNGSIKFSASDILQKSIILYQDQDLNKKFNADQDTEIQKTYTGSTFSISLSYKF